MNAPASITLADCSTQIAAYLDARITHVEIVSWAREAMFAENMPPAENAAIMDLLQDISASTEQSMAGAADTYRKLILALNGIEPTDPS
ncbi:MAG: hypothetical protein HC814_03900 [Rhodobacteraceae bacterium]|nr:hypothetical protein [Paracoccaceae bacterium]